MLRPPPFLSALGICAVTGLVACGDPGDPAGLAPEGQLQLARIALASGDARDARVAFERALEADPGSIDARLGLAESAHRLGEVAIAQRAFEEMLGLGADRLTLTVALRGLADLRREAGDVGAAQELQAQADALADEAEAR